MRQLQWEKAELIASKAAGQALGFGPQAGKVTLDVEDVRRLAERTAFMALQLAGVLDEAEIGSKRWNAAQAGKAPAIA